MGCIDVPYYNLKCPDGKRLVHFPQPLQEALALMAYALETDGVALSSHDLVSAAPVERPIQEIRKTLRLYFRIAAYPLPCRSDVVTPRLAITEGRAWNLKERENPAIALGAQPRPFCVYLIWSASIPLEPQRGNDW